MRKIMNAGRLGLVLLASAAFGLAPLSRNQSAYAHNWLGECTVNFDSAFALQNIYAQPRATFATNTAMSSSGELYSCLPQIVHFGTKPACWFYRHRCWNNYLNVEPLGYSHFHLSFRDPLVTVECGYDPGDGYGPGFGKLTPMITI